MAKKKFVKVNALAFHMVVEKIKSDKKGITALKLKNRPILNFLIDASDYSLSLSSIPVEVKVAILKTKGIDNPDSSTVADTKKMEDFGFSSIQFLRLTKRLNAVANSHNPSAKSINVSAVQNSETVKDCIDIVTKAAL